MSIKLNPAGNTASLPQVYREGSMDFRQCPSLINGVTVPYTPPKAVTSSINPFANLSNDDK